MSSKFVFYIKKNNSLYLDEDSFVDLIELLERGQRV